MRRPFWIGVLICLASAAAGYATARALAQDAAVTVAPAGTQIDRVWHLGRVTGDLDRVVRFYHDHLGLGLRGARDQTIAFSSGATINEFVNAPPHAEFRAAFLPIPGSSAATDSQNQIYLEAFEYRNIDRRQIVPSLASPGVSSLRLFVRDVDAAAAAAKASGLSVVTAGGQPVAVPVPAAVSGSARALMVRDPDGYPVELLQMAPLPRTPAGDDAKVLLAHMTVVVADLDASLAFYRTFIGPDVQVEGAAGWRSHAGHAALRALPGQVEYRRAALRLPGSTVVLELVQYRGIPQVPYRPVFQDIGHGHVAFVARDVAVTVETLKRLGAATLSRSGTWTQINPTTRAVYTRDPDGFFLEVLERR
jgi:catechol 2,3-dioxygenase-like lactoylglutathione lyase family enzyme